MVECSSAKMSPSTAAGMDASPFLLSMSPPASCRCDGGKSEKKLQHTPSWHLLLRPSPETTDLGQDRFLPVLVSESTSVHSLVVHRCRYPFLPSILPIDGLIERGIGSLDSSIHPSLPPPPPLRSLYLHARHAHGNVHRIQDLHIRPETIPSDGQRGSLGNGIRGMVPGLGSAAQ